MVLSSCCYQHSRNKSLTRNEVEAVATRMTTGKKSSGKYNEGRTISDMKQYEEVFNQPLS